jgi:hypothetical protein
MMKLIINARCEGYDTDQISYTMTVGELIECLQQYDEDTQVYIGNDQQSRDDWYTYGRLTACDICEEYEDEEDGTEDA